VTRIVVGVIVVVLTIVGVIVLRNNSMTVHERMPRDSALFVAAEARWRVADSTAPTLARALTIQCVAETSVRHTAASFAWDDGAFTFEVLPALDDADQRQLKGCLSDFRMPRLIVAVDEMRVGKQH
jgi:hypothetical protein